MFVLACAWVCVCAQRVRRSPLTSRRNLLPPQHPPGCPHLPPNWGFDRRRYFQAWPPNPVVAPASRRPVNTRQAGRRTEAEGASRMYPWTTLSSLCAPPPPLRPPILVNRPDLRQEENHCLRISYVRICFLAGRERQTDRQTDRERERERENFCVRVRWIHVVGVDIELVERVGKLERERRCQPRLNTAISQDLVGSLAGFLTAPLLLSIVDWGRRKSRKITAPLGQWQTHPANVSLSARVIEFSEAAESPSCDRSSVTVVDGGPTTAKLHGWRIANLNNPRAQLYRCFAT